MNRHDVAYVYLPPKSSHQSTSLLVHTHISGVAPKDASGGK